MRVEVTVKPHAKEARVAEREGGLDVWVTAPPADGRANEELVELLADHFEVSRQSVEIVRGHTSHKKIVDISLWQKR